MTMKDELFSRLDRTSSIEIRFRTNKTKYNKHIFFEGKTDKLFYIEMMSKCDAMPTDFVIYEYGNRDNVLKAHNDLPKRKRGESCAFFVDHDHSPPTFSSNDIYVTEEYSFENLLVKEQTFTALAKRNCGFTATEDLLRLSNMFANFLKSAARFLMRASRLKQHINTSVRPLKWENIDVLYFSQFLRSGYVITDKARCEEAFFKCGLDLKSYRASCKGTSFRNDPALVYGKGLLKLLTGFFEYVCELSIAEGRDVIKIKDKSANNLTMILAPLCPVPEDLHTFLKKKFG